MRSLKSSLVMTAAAAAVAVTSFGGSARADLLDLMTDHVYVRFGAVDLIPLPRSGPVILSDVTGPASLSIQNGPIEGSYTSMDHVLMPGGTLGYHIGKYFGVETVLGLPPTVHLRAKGTLATKSLAPTALGQIPTGVPPLGEDLGETKLLPPVLTVTYRLIPEWPVDPYIGLGATYLYAFDSKITNPVLTAVSQPELDIPATWGFVTQAGVDIKLVDHIHMNLDFKYVAGATITATIKNSIVEVPNLPLYGTAKVGTSTNTVTVNPVIFQAGIGWDF
jgi:outer membrane protein W